MEKKLIVSARNKYKLIRIVLVTIILFVSVFFGNKKEGFHIDEYYQYTLSNGTQLGIDINTGEWNDTSGYIKQLVSEGEENFHYGQMYENTANDVHPFLYYVIIHFVSSVFSGVFSKWIGLAVNICLFLPVLILTERIAWKLSNGNEIITLATVALFGLSPATISMVVLIRMYLFLALWTLLYVYVHIADLERNRLSVKGFLIPVFICGFCGFLTQYFFVIIMFFVTFAYSFYLLVFRKRVRDTLIYDFTALISLICTFFVWPSSVFHIFKGYRGKGAFSQLLDISKWGERFGTHLSFLNKMVFGGAMPLILIFLVIGIILLIKKCYIVRKQGDKPVMDSFSVSAKGIILTMISATLNYLVLTQIALVDGINCVRQYYTAYALFLILIPVCIYKVSYEIVRSESKGLLISVALVAVLLILGHVQKNVLYLYEEEKVAKDYAKDHPDAKVVVFQNDDGMYDSLIQEIILYPRVYFASVNDPASANDEEIASANELLVYIPKKSEKINECFERIYEQNPSLRKSEHVWDAGSFSAYLMR